MTRHWINTHLSRDERQQLVDWLMERAQQPTGDLIRQGLEELFPDLDGEDLPSIQACLSWRNANWQFELHRRQLRDDSEAARFLADSGNGADLDEANRILLQQMIFGRLRELKENGLKSEDAELLAAMARNVSTLARQGQAERELQAKLEKIERENAEMRHRQEEAKNAMERAKGGGGITPEMLTEIERTLKLL